MNNQEFLEKYFSNMEDIVKNISQKDIDAVIDALFEAWKRGSTVFLIGNGGSASTATHMACDLNKYCNVEGKQRFKALALVDNIPLVSALTNDNGWGDVYSEQLINFFKEGDVVIAFSVHGGSGSDKAGTWSQNLLKALQYAKDNGGVAIGLAGFDGGAMKQMADHCLIVPVESTPLTEGFHAVLSHLLCAALKEKIEKE
ncbi:MAG: SIS domain-containing protein [archaeon]